VRLSAMAAVKGFTLAIRSMPPSTMSDLVFPAPNGILAWRRPSRSMGPSTFLVAWIIGGLWGEGE